MTRPPDGKEDFDLVGRPTIATTNKKSSPTRRGRRGGPGRGLGGRRRRQRPRLVTGGRRRREGPAAACGRRSYSWFYSAYCSNHFWSSAPAFSNSGSAPSRTLQTATPRARAVRRGYPRPPRVPRVRVAPAGYPSASASSTTRRPWTPTRPARTASSARPCSCSPRRTAPSLTRHGHP